MRHVTYFARLFLATRATGLVVVASTASGCFYPYDYHQCITVPRGKLTADGPRASDASGEAAAIFSRMYDVFLVENSSCGGFLMRLDLSVDTGVGGDSRTAQELPLFDSFEGAMYVLPPMIPVTVSDAPGTFRLDPALRCDVPPDCGDCFLVCGLPTGTFPMTRAEYEGGSSAWVNLPAEGLDAVVVDVVDPRHLSVRLWLGGVEYTQSFETDFGDQATSY